MKTKLLLATLFLALSFAGPLRAGPGCIYCMETAGGLLDDCLDNDPPLDVGFCADLYNDYMDEVCGPACTGGS